MFVRYEINGTANASKFTTGSILSDIQGILKGTITSTSQLNSNVCIIASSEITGSVNATTYPVANVLLFTDLTTTGNADILQFTKGHYYANTTYLSQAKQTVQVAWDIQNFGPRIRIGNGSGNNYHPINTGNTSGDWWGTSATSNTQVIAPVNAPQTINRIFMYVTDYYFIMQFVRGNMIGTAGILDWQPSDSDNYAMSLSANTYPGMRLFAFNRNNLGTFQTANSVDVFGMTQSDYINSAGYLKLNQVGTANPGGNNNFSQQYNLGVGANTANAPYSTFYPHPMMQVNPHPYASATTINPVIPLQMMPHVNAADDANTTSIEMAMWTQFPYIYRTTDNLGAPGDTIVYNGNNYALLVLNKTGGNNITDINATRNACYLLPKLIYANTSGY